jgi:Ca-activated chloride channel family protein
MRIVYFFLISIAMAAVAQNQDSDLMTLSCVVTDRAGAAQNGLRAEDFQLRDEGRARTISRVSNGSDSPLNLALVVDVSGSQSDYVASNREPILNFLKQTIGPKDHAMIVVVGRQAWRVAALTGSPDEIAAAVGKIGSGEAKHSVLGPACRNANLPHTCGQAALWHGLYYTAAALDSAQGRKAIVVLTDGSDTGSDIKLNALIEKSQSADVPIYALKYSNSTHIPVAGAFARYMDRLAHDTGGAAFPRGPEEAFDRIQSDLRATYVLGILRPREARDGKFHRLEVKTTTPNLTVRARPGYFAAAVATR